MISTVALITLTEFFFAEGKGKDAGKKKDDKSKSTPHSARPVSARSATDSESVCELVAVM